MYFSKKLSNFTNINHCFVQVSVLNLDYDFFNEEETDKLLT